MGIVFSSQFAFGGDHRSSFGAAGFSLVELLIVIAIGALLASLAIPGYTSYLDRGKVTTAIADIKRMEMSLERFRTQNGRLPDSLESVGWADLKDPWGNAYEYLLLEGMPRSVIVRSRKDRNLAPINVDYDLYSKGKDGVSSKPIVAASSLDDVVRGRSGGWVGLAADF